MCYFIYNKFNILIKYALDFNIFIMIYAGVWGEAREVCGWSARGGEGEV